MHLNIPQVIKDFVEHTENGTTMETLGAML